jgi:hypothetical protein
VLVRNYLGWGCHNSSSSSKRRRGSDDCAKQQQQLAGRRDGSSTCTLRWMTRRAGTTSTSSTLTTTWTTSSPRQQLASCSSSRSLLPSGSHRRCPVASWPSRWWRTRRVPPRHCACSMATSSAGSAAGRRTPTRRRLPWSSRAGGAATRAKIYLVMELATGGDLLSRLAALPRRRLPEHAVRRMFVQLVAKHAGCCRSNNPSVSLPRTPASTSSRRRRDL